MIKLNLVKILLMITYFFPPLLLSSEKNEQLITKMSNWENDKKVILNLITIYSPTAYYEDIYQFTPKYLRDKLNKALKEIKSKETKILVKFIFFKSLEDIEPDFKVKGGKLDLLLNDLLLDLCVLYSFLENEDNEAFKKVRQEEEY
ncbi:MAG: hypothetical protein MK193_06385 [Lentisphaeria bacterium]|nr:hypothetical protein [Lentisphaeria bacterium]